MNQSNQIKQIYKQKEAIEQLGKSISTSLLGLFSLNTKILLIQYYSIDTVRLD